MSRIEFVKNIENTNTYAHPLYYSHISLCKIIKNFCKKEKEPWVLNKRHYFMRVFMVNTLIMYMAYSSAKKCVFFCNGVELLSTYLVCQKLVSWRSYYHDKLVGILSKYAFGVSKRHDIHYSHDGEIKWKRLKYLT